MDAKEVGEKVKDFVEKLIEENVKLTAADLDENTQFVDWLGSALIIHGCMIMLEAGCPHNIVLSRSVGCVKAYQMHKAKESLEKDTSPSIILPGDPN